LVKTIFFGNFFYGLCAVALAIEANMQQGLPLNSIEFYLLLFASTVWYYTLAYTHDPSNDSINERSAWYKNNVKKMRWIEAFSIGTSIFLLFRLYNNYAIGIGTITPFEYLLLFIFPVVGLFYYGLSVGNIFHLNLRKVGWLKPFVIAFVWAGSTTIYPAIFQQIEHNSIFEWGTVLSLWLFIKNWIFITILCIMFDIKDYASDHNKQLKTFVVRTGLRKTISFIIIPMTIAGFSAFVAFALAHHFHTIRIILNSIPFILLIVVAFSLYQRKPILYYLAIIDGQMLIKALCGISATLLIH